MTLVTYPRARAEWLGHGKIGRIPMELLNTRAPPPPSLLLPLPMSLLYTPFVDKS